MGGTYPHAINERGQIVGGVYDSHGGSRGFLLERWLPGSPLRGDAAGRRALAARLADYLAFRVREFPAVAEASKELQEKTRAKWKDLFG